MLGSPCNTKQIHSKSVSTSQYWEQTADAGDAVSYDRSSHDSGILNDNVVNHPMNSSMLESPSEYAEISQDVMELCNGIDNCNSLKEIKSFLDKDKTYEQTCNLSGIDKIKLTKKLLCGNPDHYSAFYLLTRTGLYLTCQQTNDAVLVNSIGQAILFACVNHALVNVKEIIFGTFQSTQASHFPEVVLPDNIPKQISKRFCSYRCNDCMRFIPNTEESISFHQLQHSVNGTQLSLKLVQPTDSIMKHVYHSKFLTAIESEALFKKKSKLMPCPIFDDGMGGARFLVTSKLNKAALLFPEAFLTHEIIHKIERALNKYEESEKKVFESIPEKNRNKIITCFMKALRLHFYLPFFDEIGTEIRSLYKEKNNKTMPEISVQDYFKIKETPVEHPALQPILDSLTLTDTTKQSLRHVINEQQTARYIVSSELSSSDAECVEGEIGLRALKRGLSDTGERSGWKINHSGKSEKPSNVDENSNPYPFDKDIKGLIQKALNNVAKNELKPGTSPIFIGFVPPAVADNIARTSGFLDSNWALNFAHGKYSHALTIGFLSKTGDLDQPILAEIVRHNLWGPIFDRNSYQLMDLYSSSTEEDKILPFYVTGLASTLTYNNPFNVHSLLTTGSLSQALNDINQTIQQYEPEFQTHLLNLFGKKIGVEKLTLDSIKKMAVNISALEIVLATKHQRSIDKIQALVPDIPDCGVTSSVGGNFCYGRNTITLSRKKAKQYFNKKQEFEVMGIENDQPDIFNAIPYEVIIRNVEDIDRFNSFIVYRK